MNKPSNDFKTRLAPWGISELSNKLDRFISPQKIRQHIEDGTVPPKGVLRLGKPGGSRMIYKIENWAAIKYGVKIKAISTTEST